MPLERQQEVIEAMRDRLDPPAGRARRARRPAGARRRGQRRGLVGLAAAADARRRPARRLRRPARRAAATGAARSIPLVPIVLATGWSALVLFALRIPLNPMSVTLGALVIAISTEFSVLLSERYRQERARRPRARRGAARARTARPAPRCSPRARRRSPASRCSCVSDIRMLRDFGFVTVVDLTVSLLGVLVVLPGGARAAPSAGGRGARCPVRALAAAPPRRDAT